MGGKPQALVPFHSIVTESGKTIREENLELAHGIPLGQVVDIEKNLESCCMELHCVGDTEIVVGFTGTMRMIVVSHNRDCDGTPLYGVASKPVKPPKGHSIAEGIRYRSLVGFYDHGYMEQSLTPVEGQKLEMKDYEDYRDQLIAGLDGALQDTR